MLTAAHHADCHDCHIHIAADNQMKGEEAQEAKGDDEEGEDGTLPALVPTPFVSSASTTGRCDIHMLPLLPH